jgi:RNA polymerase sigma factor (sigma-70 family)
LAAVSSSQEAVEGARKRIALETYVRHERALRRTARRYSICADDADDALQRALEILLLKAPSEDPRDLIRWTQTVVKHEALAVRRERERILSGPAAARPEPGREDWVALLPSGGDGPAEQLERHEDIARSREALQALKPQELRALSLLAEGYSYVEIGEITGYSQTKINRCLAEGRERFRSIVARSADGRRCSEMSPLLSAFCDGEASEMEMRTVREHLRACGHCRATLRAYRAAPAAVAALAPLLPLQRSLLERAHDALGGLTSRFNGAGAGDAALQRLATGGGGRGGGIAALAKVAAVCAGTVGGTACVATGVVPLSLDPGRGSPERPAVERQAERYPAAESAAVTGVNYEPASPGPSPQPEPPDRRESEPAAESAPSPPPATAGEAVEYVPPPAAAPPAPSSPAASTGNPAGEFGP